MSFIHFHHLSVDCNHGAIWEVWLTGWSQRCEVGVWDKRGQKGDGLLIPMPICTCLYWQICGSHLMISSDLCGEKIYRWLKPDFAFKKSNLASHPPHLSISLLFFHFLSYPVFPTSLLGHKYLKKKKSDSGHFFFLFVSSNIHKLFWLKWSSSKWKHMVKNRQFKDDNQYWSQ